MALSIFHTTAGQHLFEVLGASVRHHDLTPGTSLVDAVALEGVRHVYLIPGWDRQTFTPEQRLALMAHVGVSSLPHAEFLPAPAPSRKGGVLVIADPKDDLPFARKEGKMVHQRLGGTLLTGRQATRSAVLARLDGLRVLHFAGHGLVDGDDPWASNLVLADGARLTLEDILSRMPQIELAVLSGCETGRQSEISQDAALGLPDAFMWAGTKTVIATEKPLPDRDGLKFIERLYDHGVVGAPIQALRAASLEDAAGGGRTWRLFRAYGHP